MRLLWFHQHFATPAGWGSQRMYEFGRRFAAAGHEVHVLCGLSCDPSLVGGTQVTVDGLHLYVARTRYRQHMGFAARLRAFTAFLTFCGRHVLRHGRQYDLAVASSGPLTLALPALLGRRLYGLPFVFEVLDVWPDAAIDAGVLRNPVLKRLAFRLEAAAYRRARQVVTCSPAMSARVVGKGVPPAKVSAIPHGSDPDRFAADPERRARTRAELGVRDGQTVVLYCGAMGRGNAIDDVAGAVARTADDARLAWWFAGDGPEAGKLRRLAGPDNAVRFLGAVPHTRVADLHRAADIALISFHHAPVFHENSPNKCFDALAAGLPVIFNRSTWLEPDLRDCGCGYVCRCARPDAEIARELKAWAGDAGLRQRMGAAARRLAREKFSRDPLAAAYLRILEEAQTGAAP